MHKYSVVLLQPPSPKPSFPIQCNYNTSRQAGPWDCCFWPHSFLCQRVRALTTAQLLVDTTIKLQSVHFNHIADKMSGKWSYFSIMPQIKFTFFILTVPTKETILIVLSSSFDCINCHPLLCSCVTEMGSCALLTVVLVGALLWISAIHAGELMVRCRKCSV